MNMNTDSLITFFQKKIAEIDKLNGLGLDNAEFQKWHATTLATCKRMGGDYALRFNEINYSPAIFFGDDDDDELFAHSYSSGLLNAKALLEAFVEELETWGYDSDSKVEKSKVAKSQQPAINVNVSQNQTQSQSISSPINLSVYNEETQEKLKELAKEIHKPNNRSKVTPIVKWLADKSVDALIALLPTLIKFE